MNALIITLFATAVFLSFHPSKSYTTYNSYNFDTTRHHKMTITQVLKKHTDEWMNIPGVTGTGEGKSGGRPCIVVFIEHNSGMVRKKIPTEVVGYKIVLKETGKVEAR